MSTEMPKHDRRRTDARLQAIEASVAQMCDTMLEEHVNAMHPKLSREQWDAEIADRSSRIQAVEGVVSKVVETLDGKPVRSRFTGEVIDKEDGVVQKLDKILEHTAVVEERTNGGVTVTYKPQIERKYIWGALGTVVASAITATAAIVVALVA